MLLCHNGSEPNTATVVVGQFKVLCNVSIIFIIFIVIQIGVTSVPHLTTLLYLTVDFTIGDVKPSMIEEIIQLVLLTHS